MQVYNITRFFRTMNGNGKGVFYDWGRSEVQKSRSSLLVTTFMANIVNMSFHTKNHLNISNIVTAGQFYDFLKSLQEYTPLLILEVVDLAELLLCLVAPVKICCFTTLGLFFFFTTLVLQWGLRRVFSVLEGLIGLRRDLVLFDRC